MCGIVGYIGPRQATPLLLQGLHRLEYRGYDSAGIAIRGESTIEIRKTAGRVAALDHLVKSRPIHGSVGIGHTRWATHGGVSDENSHPHVGGNGDVVLVHNGVIENHAALRSHLTAKGYVFRSATDTEAVAHLIADCLEELVRLGEDPADPATCVKAVSAALPGFKGAYGLAVLFRSCPDLLVAVRNGSPLVIGVGEGEHFVASDAGPLAGYTDQVVYLSDHEMAVLRADEFTLLNRDNGILRPDVRVLDQAPGDSERNGYAHYMLKEIYEQPTTIETPSADASTRTKRPPSSAG